MTWWYESSQVARLQEVGGKGRHLQMLMSWGAPVPPFFVLNTDCFKIFLKTGLVPNELEAKFSGFFKQHPTIALRSSMIGEDQLDASFAGLFETILDVTEKNWRESLIKIYHSVNAPRVKEYLTLKNISIDLHMAVVAQAQVNVEKSGVLFTRSPVPPTAVIAIDAAYGMGEGVVSGHALVDHYQLTRTGEMVHKISNNSEPVLSSIEIKNLIDLSLKLEKESGQPSDIEWGIKENEIHIFQIRPITRSFDSLTYFVDTNLSESYPGTVSPFTAEFVKKAYENVFNEAAKFMGASGERQKNLARHYKNLITAVDDHLYYNLEHYYAALRALPGGEKNIDNWHKMIGGKLDGVEIPFHDTRLGAVESLSTIARLLKTGLEHKKVFGAFLNELDLLHKTMLDKQEKLHSSSDIIDYLADLVERPLGFGLTVLNDVYIMMGLGLLTRSLKKRDISEEKVIDLLKTEDGLDSLKPLLLFNELVRDLSLEFISQLKASDLKLGFAPYKDVFAKLAISGFQEEVKRLSTFLDTYGDRSFEELKIESLPLKNNPDLLIHLLSWAKENAVVTQIKNHNRDEFPLGWLENKTCIFTRQCISMREATRLWRGKFYHLIRMLILKLAQELINEDKRWNEFSLRDYFSLNHFQWKAFRNNELSFDDMKKIMIDKRGWQDKKQQYPELIVWTEKEKLPQINSTDSTHELSGQGVSPGVTEGFALVLDNPNEAFASELQNFILVTKNTDPAWVYIMSRSKALVSEKGSLLSHTAIIGRELNIPTIVGVRSATQRIKTNDRIRVDGSTGKIEIL